MIWPFKHLKDAEVMNFYYDGREAVEVDDDFLNEYKDVIHLVGWHRNYSNILIKRYEPKDDYR